MKNLEKHKAKIKEKVDEAINGGEEVDAPVSNWLDIVEKEVEDFYKDDKIAKENMQCFKFSCPNYISRYQMSKEAEKKMGKVKNLTQDGNFSTVAHPKPLPQELQFPSSANYANFESRELVFNSIMEALKDSNVKMIGVYGIGGVGKTTMVEEVGKQVNEHRLFDEVVMVVVSQDANVIKIQGRLADHLNLKLDKETEVGRASQLWNRLNNGKKNLILLDDIWKELNFKEIGIPFTDGNKYCKVVITSRIRGVLENMQVDRYFLMHVLSEKEAWALFKKKVGNSVDSSQLYDIANAVCKECGGLPVVIFAVGAALKDKRKYAWEDALDHLKNSMLKNIAGIDSKVYTSLKFSYDRLESNDAKSCFFLCCSFPEDVEISIEDLARHCIARRLFEQNPNTLTKARHRVLTVIDILKAACLLLEGTDENIVKMHDVIRDVALSIAKDDNKEILVKHGVQEWPEKDTCESSSTVSLRFETMHEVPNQLSCPQLHTLLLECRNPFVIVPDMFFFGMEKLTILDLNKIHMLQLPSSLANLVNLRMLCLNKCKLKDIAILKDLKKTLEILSLRGSDIEVLPSEIEQLTRLRLLDLGDCKKLTEISQGVISNLSRLEELYILNDFNPWEATPTNKEGSNLSLDELSKLTLLTTLHIHIPNVMLLPKDLCFEKLIRFNISVGEPYRYYRGFDRKYSRTFTLIGTSIMDRFNVLLEKAEELHLEKIEGLQKVVHHDRGGEGFLMQHHRLNTSRSFNKLTVLSINDCRLKYLFSPSCARGIQQLQQLNVLNCTIMEEIVGIEEEKDEEKLTSQVINISQLKHIKLCNLPNLITFYLKMEKTTSEENSSTKAQSLFNEKVTFPALEKLYIQNLLMITEIWDRKLLQSESFCQLRTVDICECDNLVNVVSSNMLQRREIVEDNDNIISFPQLRSLSLANLQSLKCFCTSRFETQSLFNSQVSFPFLEYLTIEKVPNVTEIWDKQLLPLSQLQNLKALKVIDCRKVEVIVAKEKEGTNDDVIVFSQLTTLTLQNLMNLKRFNNWPIISEAQPLFNHQVSFPVLEYLTIEKVPTVTEIWDKQLLPLSQLQNLKELKVIDCPNVEVIVAKGKEGTNDDVIVFSQLTTLTLQNLMNLKRFNNWPIISEAQPLFNHQVAFPVLEDLMIINVPNIIEIWDKQLLITAEKESKSFCQLRYLFVWGCPKLEVMVSEKEEEKGPTNDDIIVFSQLTTLFLSELMNLKSFYSWPTRSKVQTLFNHQDAFPKLEEVYLYNCVNSSEIHPWNVLAGKTSLKVLRVYNCNQVSTIASPHLVQRLQTTDKLIVKDCSEVTQVFQLEGLNVGEGQHVRPLTEVRMMELDGLPQLTCLWNKDPLGILGLQSLQYLTIKKCSLLRNLFTRSTAMALEQLKVLYLESCPMMEEVIATDEGHKEVTGDEIEFPKLEWLILKDLPNLNSFCNANYNFNLPSLQRVVLKRCPKMQTFTSGQVHMSQILLSTRGDEGLHTEDLNRYLEQRLLNGEECATIDENDYRGKEEKFSVLFWLRE